MSFAQKILVLTLSLSVLIFTVELIRRRKLREEYALLWILTGVVVIGFAMFPSVLYYISEMFGLHHLTTLLFITFIFLLVIVLHFSTVISRHSDNETELAQRLAILELKFSDHMNKKQADTEENTR